jgi:putative effector of murein hydrolase
VAPYLFILAARKSSAVPNTGVAADLIGPLLYSSDVLGLVVGAGLILALILLRRRNEVPLGSKLFISEIGVGVAVLCAAVNYWVFAPQLQAIQMQLAERYGAFHQADQADPLFQQFSGLHQTSTSLFMAGFVAALVCLVCMTQFRSRMPAS